MSVKSNPSTTCQRAGSNSSETWVSATRRAYSAAVHRPDVAFIAEHPCAPPCDAGCVNPSTAQAVVIVDELVRNDIRHVVVCPGSRNAPLSMALHQAAADGRLNLHVRIDERSASYLALGLSTGDRPAAAGSTAGPA